MKTAKYLLRKSENFSDFQQRLMAWRNMPSANSNLSPAEKFFNRRQRAQLPALPPMPRPAPPPTNTSKLRPFVIGDRVLIQNPHTKTWDEKGKILEIRETGLSYLVDREADDPCVRGRVMLKLDRQASPADPPRAPSPDRHQSPKSEEKDAPKTKKKSTPKRRSARARRSNRRRRQPDRLQYN